MAKQPEAAAVTTAATTPASATASAAATSKTAPAPASTPAAAPVAQSSAPATAAKQPEAAATPAGPKVVEKTLNKSNMGLASHGAPPVDEPTPPPPPVPPGKHLYRIDLWSIDRKSIQETAEVVGVSQADAWAAWCDARREWPSPKRRRIVELDPKTRQPLPVEEPAAK